MRTVLESLPDFRLGSADIWTSGQPDLVQLASLAAEGIQCVINLGVLDSPYAHPEERQVVESAGMDYVHIPVLFNHPKQADYLKFEAELQRRAGQRLLIHCVRNFRVSAFLTLYRVRHQGWSREKALDALTTFWRPEPAWSELLESLFFPAMQSQSHSAQAASVL